MLHGRQLECGVIGRLLADARLGHSGALVLRGEVGVGKSALLAHARTEADGMTVLRATGIESESELPFAALQQLLGPLLPDLDQLPATQAAMLRAAFGLGPPRDANRFVVGLGVLSLLGQGSEERPLLCLVDDAHWLDRPSIDALLFAVRRLEAEGIAVLFAARDFEVRGFDAPGLTELVVAGLDPEAADLLLVQRFDDLAVEVRQRLIAETGGNPLALLELPAVLTAGQRAGQVPLEAGSLPIGDRLQRIFTEQTRRLPGATQRLLVIAACEEAGDLAAILEAAKVLDVDPSALSAAEDAGLVRLDEGSLVFRHPLIRSAIYNSATFSRRRLAHRALARVMGETGKTDQRTWHLAATALKPNEPLAEALEHSAATAARRRGYGAAVAALERAAALSPSDESRARRLVRAADASMRAGRGSHALALLDCAAPPGSHLARSSHVTHLRAELLFSRGSTVAAFDSLLAGAAAVAESDPATAAAMLRHAAWIAWYVADCARMTEVGHRLTALPLSSDGACMRVARMAALLGRLLAGDGRSLPELRLALSELSAGTPRDMNLRQLMAVVAVFAGDEVLARQLTEATVDTCRARGLLGWLPMSLAAQATAETFADQYAAATATATDGVRLGALVRQPNTISLLQALLAWNAAVRGDERACRQAAAVVMSGAWERGLRQSPAVAAWALGLLELGIGRPEEAVPHLQAIADPATGHPVIAMLAASDLVEAAARVGDDETARMALVKFESWASCTDQSWASAVTARGRALVAEDDTAERHFEEALSLHAASDRRPFERGRTELAYGQWLRRARRPSQCRPHLRTAARLFALLDAEIWAQRAEAELRASGVSSGRRDRVDIDRLTPQELQIVQLAAAGHTNRAIAARLFLSSKTVAYHLYKAFPKLGISSRRELLCLSLDRRVDRLG